MVMLKGKDLESKDAMSSNLKAAAEHMNMA